MKWLAISYLSVDNIHDKKGLSNIGFLIQLYVYIRVREIGASWIIHNESSYRATLKSSVSLGRKGEGRGVLLFLQTFDENTATSCMQQDSLGVEVIMIDNEKQFAVLVYYRVINILLLEFCFILYLIKLLTAWQRIFIFILLSSLPQGHYDYSHVK
jgi:hypothetical protein